MKKPIIFLSIFLVLYIANLLVLTKTTGVQLVPSSAQHSEGHIPLLTKAPATFNPIPLNLIKDATPATDVADLLPKVDKPVTRAQDGRPLSKIPTPVATPKTEQEAPVTKEESQEAQTTLIAGIPAEEEVIPAPQAKPVEAAKPAPKAVTAKAEPKAEAIKPTPVKAEPKQEVIIAPAPTPKATVKKEPKKEPVKKEVKPAAPAPKVAPKVAPKPTPKAEPKAAQQPKEEKAAPAPAPAKPTTPQIKTDSSAKFNEAGLIDIEALPIKVFLDIKYATAKNFTGKQLYANPKCYLNKTTADAFVKAVFLAQDEGMYFCVYDCYRPSSVQKIMWDKDESSSFLSSRGGAVDIGPCDAAGKPLPSPTSFDTFTEQAASSAKDGIAADAIENRTTLQKVMKDAGFSTVKNEWWHFDYEDAKDYPILDLRF